MTAGWVSSQGAYPAPPKNAIVVNPFIKGTLDLRWDDPNLLTSNTLWEVLGVNIYRSGGSDRGPYRRLNTFPLGGAFYRDFTDNILISNEVISWEAGWISRGASANERNWVLRTRYPIVKRNFMGVFANAPSDVQVFVDGNPVEVSSVFGDRCSVTLVNTSQLNPINEDIEPFTPPTSSSQVTISYYTEVNRVGHPLDKKSFYRITTVARNPDTGEIVETPLNVTEPTSDIFIEQLDYIWREAIRRNQWILEQGGERVKLFVQKTSGVRCSCVEVDDRLRSYSKQPSNRCEACYGTGFVGGYEGPYDIIIGPDDAEKRITQTQTGRRQEHTYEVFIGPSPIVSQRDFVVKLTNDRYSIGPVRRPSNRGNILQQHFSIAYLDQADIRYKVPITDPATYIWPQTRYTYWPYRNNYTARKDAPWPTDSDNSTPEQTNKSNVPQERQLRGRTGTFENQNY